MPEPVGTAIEERRGSSRICEDYTLAITTIIVGIAVAILAAFKVLFTCFWGRATVDVVRHRTVNCRLNIEVDHGISIVGDRGNDVLNALSIGCSGFKGIDTNNRRVEDIQGGDITGQLVIYRLLVGTITQGCTDAICGVVGKVRLYRGLVFFTRL